MVAGLTLHVHRFEAMASANELQLYAASEAEAARVAALAIEEVRRIERVFSRYRDDSVTSRINRAAGGPAVEVDEETAALLDYGAACHAKSGGLFDLTSGVLRRAWDFRNPALPDKKKLATLRALVGWSRVEWKRPWLRLPLAGMEIDFGGIGKEYAADRAAGVCLAAGVRHGLVNLGGDVRVIGPHPDGSAWSIGIRHPRQDGAVLATVALTSGALATSGDYERFFEIEGRRYCHILDPRSGYPVDALRSASVAAPLCILAGSLSTIAMLKGREAEAFLRAESAPFLLCDRDGGLLASAVAIR